MLRLAEAARAKNLTDQAAELERASLASSRIEDLRQAVGRRRTLGYAHFFVAPVAFDVVCGIAACLPGVSPGNRAGF